MKPYLNFIAKELEAYHGKEGIDVYITIDQEELKIILEQVISLLIRDMGKEETMNEIENAMQ